MKFSIRLLYLYLFASVGLIISVVGTVQLVDLGIKVFVFKGADQYEYSRPVKIEGEENVNFEEEKAIQERENRKQRQRQVSTALSLLLVGIPLYKYHWRIIQDKS